MTFEATRSGRPDIAPVSEASSRFSPNALSALFAQVKDRQIPIAIGKIYALKFSGAGMAYLVQLAVAFFLGATNYGVFALAWITATTVGQILCCGFNDSTGRFLPAYLEQNDQARARGFANFALQFSTMAAVAVVFAFLAIAILSQNLIPEIYFGPVILALLCAPILTYTHLKESIAVSRSHIIAGLLPTYVLRPFFLIVITVGAVLLSGQNTPIIAVAGLVFASVAVAIIQSRLLAKPLAKDLGAGDVIIEKTKWLWASLPLFLAQGFFVLSTSIDVFILSFFVAPADLGIYFAAAKMVALLAFVHAAVASGLTRRLSEALARDDYPAFRHQFKRGRIWMLVPTLFGAGFLMLGAPFFLSMFGSEFVIGAPLVTILVIGVCAQAMGGPIQEALIVSGHQKAVSFIIGAFFFINVVFSLIMVKTYGMEGVAIASTCSIAGRIAIMNLYARYYSTI